MLKRKLHTPGPPRSHRNTQLRLEGTLAKSPFLRRICSSLSSANSECLEQRGSCPRRFPSRWLLGIRRKRRTQVLQATVRMRNLCPFFFLRWHYPDQVSGSSPWVTSQQIAPQLDSRGEWNSSTFLGSHSGCMNGYLQSCGTSSVRLTDLGLIHRNRLRGPPALSFVPLALAPPNGCWATTAPVGLSLM